MTKWMFFTHPMSGGGVHSSIFLLRDGKSIGSSFFRRCAKNPSKFEGGDGLMGTGATTGVLSIDGCTEIERGDVCKDAICL